MQDILALLGKSSLSFRVTRLFELLREWPPHPLKTSLICEGRLFQPPFTLPGRASESQSKNPVVLHSPLRTAERGGRPDCEKCRRGSPRGSGPVSKRRECLWAESKRVFCPCASFPVCVLLPCVLLLGDLSKEVKYKAEVVV